MEILWNVGFRANIVERRKAEVPTNFLPILMQ